MPPSILRLMQAALVASFFTNALTAQNCTGNLLQNPGFESGLTGWEGGGTIVADAHSGTKALSVCTPGQPIRQTVAAVVGQVYTVQLWGKKSPLASSFDLFLVKYLNSSFMPIKTEFFSIGFGTWGQTSPFSTTAPAATAWLELSVQISSGTGCVLVDDVCLTTTGGGNAQPDLTINNLTLNSYQVQAGKVFSYRFDLANASSAAVPGNFSMKAYLSTDDILSADDVQDGIVTTGNFGANFSVPQVLGATTVPASLPSGDYFLILKADADNQVLESNEGNNVAVGQSPVHVVAASTGGGAACDKFIGNGSLVCAQPAAVGSQNIQTTIDGGGLRTRTTVSPAGTIVSTENLGVPPPFFPVSIAGGGAVEKRNGDGSLVYSKPIPAGLMSQVGSFTSVAEFGTGYVLLGWKAAAGNQSFFLDSLFAFKTDANLNMVLKKFLALGTGYPGGNTAHGLLQIGTDRLAFIQNSSPTGGLNWTGVLWVIDGNLTQKSQKILYTGIWSAGASIRPNVCRGFTVTDSQGLGYCKSGGCFISETFDGEFVNDQFVTYNSFRVHHQTQVGIGFENHDWTTATSDGGRITGERHLTGSIYQSTNDTVVLKKFNAANALLWTKYVRPGEPGSVRRVTEAGGEVYFHKVSGGGDWTVSPLSCIEGGSGGPCSPDATPPVVSNCPSSQTLTTTGTSATASWTVPSATDNCPGTVNLASNVTPGSAFPLGTTTVVYTAKDAANNTATCSFTITVSQTGGSGCATNLLQNPGFENNLTNWEGSGGTVSTTASAGTKSLKLCQNGSVRQTLSTAAGKNLTLLFKARSETGAGKILSYIKYLSSTWQPLVTEFFDFSTTATFASGTVSKAAVAGSAWVEIGFLKQTAGCVFIDETCLSESGNSGGQPNLAATVFDISTSNILLGGSRNFGYIVTNTSAVSAGAYKIKVFLSPINMPGQPDVLLATVPKTGLAANSNTGFTNATITIPTNTTTGLYNIGMKVDADNELPESNEADNALAAVNPMAVTTPGQVCEITATASNKVCNNNGTPNNPADDTFTFEITASGNFLCGQCLQIPDAQLLPNGNHLSKPFSIAAGEASVLIAACNYSADITLKVAPPATCSSGSNCSISVVLGGTQCNDSGTPTNPGDDTYSATATISNTGICGSGWTSNTVPASGSFGTAPGFGPYPISGGNKTVTFTAQGDPTKTATVTFTAPPTCSNQTAVCAGNLLTNGDFEQGATGWTGVFATTGITSSSFCSGPTYVRLSKNTTISQTVAATAGKTYSLNVRGDIYKQTDMAARVGFRFKNGATVLDSAFAAYNSSGGVSWESFPVVSSSGCSYSDITLLKAAPVGATSVEVLGQHLGQYLPTALTQVKFDAFCLTETGGNGGSGADLKLTLTSDKATVPQWGNVTLTLTAKNEGTTAISQANLNISICDGTGNFVYFVQASGLVYAGTPPPPTVGNYNLVSNLWTIPGLAPGQAATLTLPLFALTTAEKKIIAWSALQSPTDPDSQPGGKPANCTPAQDDESRIVINQGQTGQSVVPQSNGEAGAEIADFALSPNPTDGSFSIDLTPFLGKKLGVEIGSAMGKTVFSESIAELRQPGLDVDLSSEMDGVYFVKIAAEGRRAVIKRVVIQKL